MTKEIEEEKTDSTEEEASDEEAKPAAEEEEKETPAPSSGEEKPTEESEEEPEKKDKSEEESEAVAEGEEEPEKVQSEGEEKPEKEEPEKVQPKPVEGETVREKALRMEVVRLRGNVRKARGIKLLGDVQPRKVEAPVELSEEDKKTLKDFDPEQLAGLDKVLDIRIKQGGFVKKDEFLQSEYQKDSQDVFETWMENHPEYSIENDPDSIIWNRFQADFDLYKKPANPKVFNKIFNKIHNDIFGITTQPKETAEQVAAKQQKIKVASAGAKTSVTPKKAETVQKTTSQEELSKVARDGGLKGFSEKEFTEMNL